MYTIILILKQRSTVGQILVFAVIAALFLGFVGNVQLALTKLPAEDQTPARVAKVVMESVPAAMRVFTPKLHPDPGNNGWALTIGELLGALAAFAALLAVIATILAEFWERVRISRLNGHSIIIGLDDQAELFLDAVEEKRKPDPVVMLDIEADETSRAHAHAKGCYHYAASDKQQIDRHLNSCAVARARRLVISTGDDTKNLEIVRKIAESDALRTRQSLDVLLVVEDAYTYHRLEESDAFMQCLGTAGQLRLFSPAGAAAEDLFSKVNVTQLARERGQSRSVLLICGQDDTATEIVCQHLKTSPNVGMDKPRLHWIVRDRAQAMRDLSQTVPPLWNLIRADGGTEGPLAWAAEVAIHEPSAHEASSEQTFLERVIGQDHVSAIVVTGTMDGPANPIRTAHAIREAARRVPAVSAPLFVFSPQASALDELLDRIPNKKQIPDGVIEPFGRVVEMQDWGGADATREKHARALHEKYLSKRTADTDAQGARDASRKPWEALPETYKIANRRAASHVEMVTYWRDQLVSSGKERSDANVLETLAQLEHDAWSIDRELDGWRYAPERDNTRKLHPNLVPYEELTDEIKDYDRAQVRNLLEAAGHHDPSCS